MTFVSYAQNHEDVMLARVFRSLATGFYIDVGAQDPRIDSVTKAFYDQGWHGINLEPVEFWYQKLCQERPRDINLGVAAGAAQGVVDFFEIPDTGLSTSSADFAQRHQAQGYAPIARKVQVRTLDAICAEHGVETVHFLKVDAEGAEADVLRGIDLAKLRPWLILVEATEPNSSVSTHAGWESLLLDRGYLFVYNDGLNRFYLASEHAGLAAAFATPPNVHDDFVLRQILDHQGHEQGLATHIAAVEGLSQLRAEQIGRLDQIVAEKDAALASGHADLLQAQAEVSRLHEAVADRELSLSHLRTELSERELKLSERETTLSALQQLLAGREADISALQLSLAEREASIATLRSALAEREAELQARKARVALLSTRLQASGQAVEDLSRTVLDLQAARLAAEAGWSGALLEHEASLAALARAQRDFQDIVSSRSWRLTSPLRRVMTLAVAARNACLVAIRRLASNRSPDPADAMHRGGGEHAIPLANPTEPPAPPPRALAISEDAEQILARYPVLKQAPADEGVR